MPETKFIAKKTIPKKIITVYIEKDDRTGKWIPKVSRDGYAFYINWNPVRKAYETTPRLDQAISCPEAAGATEICNSYEPNLI